VRICVFEDEGVVFLEPLTLTRPAFDLLCGRHPLLHRHARHFDAVDCAALVRPALAELCRLHHPDMAINDPAWFETDLTVLVNARWLPAGLTPGDLHTPRVALVGQQVAYVVLRPQDLRDCSPDTLADCVATWKETMPHTAAGGWMINYPWDLIEHNAEQLIRDFLGRSSKQDGTPRPSGLTLVGPSNRMVIDPSARIEPFVVADTTNGPIVIDREAVIHSFSRLEGPCWVGPESWVVGAKIKGSSIGPQCRVGGEVEASILHGCSNKYHDGFLGHSYVGEWVNLAAGTQTSDLRNDYEPVVMPVGGRRVNTGLIKVGSFLGDHTKTGLGVLMNTGSLVGTFCNVLPSGTYLPRVIPSFCTVGRGQVQQTDDLDRLFATAARAMRRRNVEFSDTEAVYFRALYQGTAIHRENVVSGGELLSIHASV
jgi:UDP-N-acetylglucosamine diphosphorylase/glucosamine-1-phosphate N-acetyltransferase